MFSYYSVLYLLYDNKLPLSSKPAEYLISSRNKLDSRDIREELCNFLAQLNITYTSIDLIRVSEISEKEYSLKTV
ncbi:MAG TPA: hypothetical protein VKR32_10980 [Puia sp.]|nr:hypothetical protein [Puia sp.]